MNSCITKDCPNSYYCRGICYRCFMRYAKRIERKKTTWDELYKDGLVTNRTGILGRISIKGKWFLEDAK